MASAALAAAVALAGCNSDGISLANNAKANKPVPERLIAEMQKKDMDLQSPILVRLFKQEAELEVWKQNRSGDFALLATYPICRWSGDLGPKIREGDRQAPEGFYSITPAQMNPQSAYYLSFNIGYPNAYDRALGRTGSELMVHGDCSSRGCYAMTDEQISDIYTLGRESFFGGQRAFQVQAYPFRMTALNMARHRNNPNMPFWRMLKVGYDHFEVTRHEPKVDFCEKKYVFDAAPPPGSTRPLVFNASAKCPAYVIPDDIEQAVRAKEQKDDNRIAQLISRGTPVAPLHTGIDGGMNKVFASKIPNGQTGLSDAPPSFSFASTYERAPGTIPGTVNPPRATVGFTATASAAEDAAATEAVERDEQQVTNSGIAGLLRRQPAAIAADASPTGTTPAAKPRVIEMTKPAHEAKPHETARIAARPPFKPAISAPPRAVAAAPEKKQTPAAPATMAGAAPVVSSNSFDSRWSAVR